MTNRRSLQTYGERMSRQTQFVPGHVGGRVASAQPLGRRRTIGAVQGPPGTPPTAATLGRRQKVDGQTVSIDAPPVGTTMATVWVASVGGKGLTSPSGWTVLANGDHGTANGNTTSMEWWLLGTTSATGTEQTTFTFATDANPAGNHYVVAVWAYYSGTGSGGGAFTATQGPTYSSSNTGAFTSPPVGAALCWQVIGATAVYGSMSVPSGVGYEDGPVGAAYRPNIGTYSGASFLSAFGPSAALDEGDAVTWSYIGAYGVPNSISFAVTWSP